MNKVLILFFGFLCFSISSRAQVQVVQPCIEEVMEDEDFKETTITCLVMGDAPIVLYQKDLSDLKIREIEIRRAVEGVKWRDKKVPVSLSVRFNQSGVFIGFSVANFDEEGAYRNKWRVLTDVSTIISSQVGDFPEYDETCEIRLIKSPEDDEYGITASILDHFQIHPFISKNGYLYKDTIVNGYKDTLYNANTILYKKEKPVSDDTNLWFVSRQVKSTPEILELYEQSRIGDGCGSFRTINTVTNDTTGVKYYYYGDNPSSLYYSHNQKIQGEEGDEVEYMVTDYSVTYFKDSIYNSNRWLGFSDEDFSEDHNRLRKSYYSEGEEAAIVEDFYKDLHVSSFPLKDFYINGELGYDYLLKAYNERIIEAELKAEVQDNLILNDQEPEKAIEKIKSLPKRIIVQTTLTDFWMIQLTE